MAKFPEKMLLKLPEGTLARIDALCEKLGGRSRSELIREWIEAGVDCDDDFTSTPKPEAVLVRQRMEAEASARSIEREPTTRRERARAWAENSPHGKHLLDLIRTRRLSSRQARDAMDLTEGLYRKVEEQLMTAGLVRVEGGVLVEVGA